jgi:hypothetical protein
MLGAHSFYSIHLNYINKPAIVADK